MGPPMLPAAGLRAPSLCEKIQYGCLNCLGSEQPSCFSCRITLGCNFQKTWATAQNIDQAIKKVRNFTLFANIMGLALGHEAFF